MAVFCSSLISCFPVMLLRYSLSDIETVPVSPLISGIIFVFTFYVRCISVVRTLYFKIFSASFLSPFLSPHIATSTYTRSFFIITNYDVRFIVRNGSVGLHSFLPPYTNLTFSTCFDWFWCIVIAVFVVLFYPYILAYVKEQFSTHCIIYLSN